MITVFVLALSACTSDKPQPAEPTAEITQPAENKTADETTKPAENKPADETTRPAGDSTTDKPADDKTTDDTTQTTDNKASDDAGGEKTQEDAPAEDSDDKDTARILDYLKSIPEAGVSDFDINNPGDEIEQYLVGGWFHEIIMLRNDRIFGWFAVADDLSAVCRVDEESSTLIAGSLENTLKRTQTYSVYNEEDEQLCEFEEGIVSAIVVDGAELTAGTSSEVTVVSPWESLLESISVASSNPEAVGVNGTEITALAPGEAVLTVSYVYGGSPKTDEIPIEVIEADPETEYSETEYIDERYTTYHDFVSQRAVLEICHEDDIYSADIIWGDTYNIIHHWSYIATDENNGNLTLNGSYCIETYNDDGTVSNEVVSENIGATLTLGADGYYYWNDEYEDAGKECIFEKVY